MSSTDLLQFDGEIAKGGETGWDLFYLLGQSLCAWRHR